ncbi:AEC family transporter [Lachnoclostridium sp. An181]|uniref:AEC family transporter n=1 Tax=Lachnoclostridium sp. An181 TaxID=1965575 RepID=UPI001FA88342|nr:AEC family transporter [Lachnoclostridium sp. An181]
MFENMVNMQLMMFSFVAVGYLIRRKGIVSTRGRQDMVDLCIYVTLPFNIFCAFQMEFEWNMLLAWGEILLLSVGYNVISVLLGKTLYKKEKTKRRPTLEYGTIVSNGGFLGNPVVEGIYGSSGLLYASVFMLPVRIVMWSIGTACFMGSKKENLLKKVLTHPCIVAIYLGMLYMISGLELPRFLDSTFNGISGCNMPLSMMLVGMMLAEMNPKGLIDKQMIFYTSMRLVWIPAIVFVITAFLPVAPLMRGVTVIIAGMPAPVTTALLSSKYDGDEDYATAMIFVTTILSLVTLPLWSLLLG